jgi:hypothetical protein
LLSCMICTGAARNLGQSRMMSREDRTHFRTFYSRLAQEPCRPDEVHNQAGMREFFSVNLHPLPGSPPIRYLSPWVQSEHHLPKRNHKSKNKIKSHYIAAATLLSHTLKPQITMVALHMLMSTTLILRMELSIECLTNPCCTFASTHTSARSNLSPFADQANFTFLPSS